MIQALQGLHPSEILKFDNDGADEDGQNDIDISSDKKNYTMGSFEKLQNALTDLITECDNIFRGRSMKSSVDEKNWESSGNRMASRQISMEKQFALKTLIDELLNKEVMRPSKATAW